MDTRSLRLAMVLFWLAATLALFTREAWAPGHLLERLNSENLSLGGWLSLGLTLYNLVRLFMTPRAGRGSGPSFREKLQARRRKAPREAYNPDLDFTRPADPAP